MPEICSLQVDATSFEAGQNLNGGKIAIVNNMKARGRLQ